MKLMSSPSPDRVIGRITLGAPDQHGGYMVRHTTDLRIDAAPHAQVQALPAGASVADAVHAATLAARASTSPAGTPLGRAFAVLQARDGALAIKPLQFELDGERLVAAIDGPLPRQWGATEIRVGRASTELLAIVGSESWIDLSAQGTGTPRPLPTPHVSR